MILDIYRDARDIDHLESCGRHCDSVAPRPNARKCIQAGIVCSHAGAGITIDVHKLYLGTPDVQPGRIHDLTRNCRSFGLCPGKVGDEGEEQAHKTILHWNSTIETGIDSRLSIKVCSFAETFCPRVRFEAVSHGLTSGLGGQGGSCTQQGHFPPWAM